MREVYIEADNIISPLGSTTAENFRQLRSASSGIRKHESDTISPVPYYASVFSEEQEKSWEISGSYSKFEQLLIGSITEALTHSKIQIEKEDCLLVISTTKGNIGLLDQGANETAEDLSLHASAARIAKHFNHTGLPVVISNACISGMAGLIVAKRMLSSGKYNHAVVAGADLLSEFILSGFQSFQAVSEGPCRPFDAARKGINLGEAAATIILTTSPVPDAIVLAGGAVSNDANHISGPSRTGEELFLAIKNALNQAGVQGSDIGFISAHGTATIYNDEMEAKAIALSGMEATPVNSLKGFYGHTLGAAGLVESVISIKSLQENIVLPTPGYKERGVSKEVNVTDQLLEFESRHFLKTASGFGGCNAALVFSKQ